MGAVAKTLGCAPWGLDTALVTFELDIANGLPQFAIVGLPDAALQEARERVRAAIRNAGLDFPLRRVTVNPAPAERRKEGAGFDLPIALAILRANDQLRTDPDGICLGELAPDGTIRPVRGTMPRVRRALARAPTGSAPITSGPPFLCGHSRDRTSSRRRRLPGGAPRSASSARSALDRRPRGGPRPFEGRDRRDAPDEPVRRTCRARARGLAAAGVVIVSGLAQDIDCAAHASAVAGGRASIAVLGEGITSFRANAHGRQRRIATPLGERGALVSPYPPIVPAQGWMFAKRNAVIAALARAVVVVEAPAGSGGLITAADAVRLGRPLFAVPGPIGARASEGTNALIAAGTAWACLGPDQRGAAIGVRAARTTLQADPLLEARAGGPLDIDELARRTRIGRGALDARLVALVLSGAVAGRVTVAMVGVRDSQRLSWRAGVRTTG